MRLLQSVSLNTFVGLVTLVLLPGPHRIPSAQNPNLTGISKLNISGRIVDIYSITIKI
jgi:hypothetical protein